jgi:single-strand DNA-binding protein
MNSVHLIGRLGAEPEFKNTSGGKSVCKLRMAVDSGRGEYRRTDWFNVVAFAGLAEVCGKSLSKGRQVAVRGSVHFSKWTKQDGTIGYSTEIYADEVEFLGGGERTPAKKTYPNGPGDVADYEDEFSAGGGINGEEMPF